MVNDGILLEIVLAVLAVFGLFALRRAKAKKNANLQRAYEFMHKRMYYVITMRNSVILKVLARELANELMQRDANFYREKFEGLYEEWQNIKGLSEKEKKERLAIISAEYEDIKDFDSIWDKPHVLYAESLIGRDNESLWHIYESIRLFHAINVELFEEWLMFGAITISEGELVDVREYCKAMIDTKLLAHLRKAQDQYLFLTMSKCKKEKKSDWMYETADYKFRKVEGVVENGIGVYVKALNRYGMWSVFVGDDYMRTSFFATNDIFEYESAGFLNCRVCADAQAYESSEVVRF